MDEIIVESRGSIYPAKDARMSSRVFMESFPRLNEFVAFRDPSISSNFSRRVMGW